MSWNENAANFANQFKQQNDQSQANIQQQRIQGYQPAQQQNMGGMNPDLVRYLNGLAGGYQTYVSNYKRPSVAQRLAYAQQGIDPNKPASFDQYMNQQLGVGTGYTNQYGGK